MTRAWQDEGGPRCKSCGEGGPKHAYDFQCVRALRKRLLGTEAIIAALTLRVEALEEREVAESSVNPVERCEVRQPEH